MGKMKDKAQVEQLPEGDTERCGKDWICDVCATARGWYVPAGTCNTVIAGLCGHCDSLAVQTLTPIVDFQRGKIKPIFD